MKGSIVAIDIGTTSMRSSLFDESGAMLHLARKDNPPLHYPDGRVEQDPDSWGRHLEGLLSECSAWAAQEGYAIEALSLTSQRSSVIPLDRSGQPLRPAIMWQDLRTQALCTRMESQNRAVYSVCGMKVTPVMSAVKMLWIKENEPAVYARTWKMAGIHDYILYLLTGEIHTDPSLASRTNLLNLEKLSWDDGLVSLFDIDEDKLCEMLEAGSRAGMLSPEIAARTGIAPGTPVISAGGDQQCAALGMGLYGDDRIVANTGTGSYLLAHSSKPVLDGDMRVFCNASAIPGSYVVEAGMPASGVIWRWFAEKFYSQGASASACVDFAEVNAEAQAAARGSGGLLFLPHFKGSGAPHFNSKARGTFHHLDLHTSRGDIGRSILEGIVAEMADNLELLEGLTRKVERVNSSGGLSSFGLFNQIQADMYGRRVRTSNQPEATALGAWMSAAAALGWYPSIEAAGAAVEAGAKVRDYEPEPEGVEFYQGLKARHRALYAALYSVPNLVD